MSNTNVLYADTQKNFFQDVITNKVVGLMEKKANKVFTVSEAEKRSWEANVYKIKELLEGSGVTDTYIVFEYFLPFGLQRIDCMLLGKDALKRDNVILIELKQWSNQTVHCSTAAGNFRISPDSVSALTGGCWREVEHPSQQVRGYCGHLQNFVDVISKEQWVLTGVAYCYNYSRNPQEGVATLFDPQFDKLQKDFRTYAKEDTSELMDKIQAALCNGKGADVFEKMKNSPIKASQKHTPDCPQPLNTEVFPIDFKCCGILTIENIRKSPFLIPCVVSSCTLAKVIVFNYTIILHPRFFRYFLYQPVKQEPKRISAMGTNYQSDSNIIWGINAKPK